MDKKFCVGILLAMLASAVLCGPMAKPESARRDLMKKDLIRSLLQLREEMSKAEAVREINFRPNYQTRPGDA